MIEPVSLFAVQNSLGMTEHTYSEPQETKGTVVGRAHWSQKQVFEHLSDTFHYVREEATGEFDEDGIIRCNHCGSRF